ncbi:unnamed protein product [Heligmosomoides polygyrus]|uniref:ZP domain-containing protein n=1 Tax=Heligmosomoides polygyrus TaxID=6339 RepID=A0A183GKY5_HELPZ|nr:unnamed protein product [Heligmosomoides polygyrus]
MRSASKGAVRCSTDSYLLPQIQYDAKALLAFTDTQVFKYADKVQLYFTCTVQLCYKHDGGCEGVTPPQCDNDPGHLQHVELAFPGDHAPTMVPIFKLPDFPSNIPFDRMSRKELREPDFGHHTEHYSRERESGGSSREGSQFDDIPRGLSDKAKKKRRDLTMETDLSTDVIVLPFQKTKSGRPLLSTTHVCVSRTALVLLMMAALITIALCVVVAVIISRRPPASYQKSMDAFH